VCIRNNLKGTTAEERLFLGDDGVKKRGKEGISTFQGGREAEKGQRGTQGEIRENWTCVLLSENKAKSGGGREKF